MQRRAVLRHAGVGLSGLVAAGLAGCSSDGGGTETEELPELELSGQRLESTVDELSIVDQRQRLLRGRQHEDIHFAVTLTVRNTGDQEASLEDYEYEIRLYSPEDIEITPGNTWAINPDTVAPGETGTILLQVSFISSESVSPEDVDRYEVTLSCGGDGAGSYC